MRKRYLIVFQTAPGFGLFEATVSFKDINDVKTFKLLGDVSRTNKYKNQSHCVGLTFDDRIACTMYMYIYIFKSENLKLLITNKKKN
jgi:hypothetical protein